MIVEGVMTELKQESHSKTFEVLLSKTHACVVLCLYSLLFCNALRNTFLPFPLLTFFFFYQFLPSALLSRLSAGSLT